PLGAVVDRFQLIPRQRTIVVEMFFAGYSAAERDGCFTYRAYARAHRDRRHGALASHAWGKHALAARNRSCRDRDANGSGAETCGRRHQTLRLRARRIREARLAMERAVRRYDQAANDPVGCELRLEP